jgi:hypothetical protein
LDAIFAVLFSEFGCERDVHSPQPAAAGREEDAVGRFENGYGSVRRKYAEATVEVAAESSVTPIDGKS